MGKEIILHKLSAGGPNSVYGFFRKLFLLIFSLLILFFIYEIFWGEGLDGGQIAVLGVGAGIFYLLVSVLLPTKYLEEVFDGGNYLLIRNKKGEEKQILLEQIDSFSYESNSKNPEFHFSYHNGKRELISDYFICPFNYYQEEPIMIKLIIRIKAAQAELKK